jgi:hypothetical protein
MRERRPEGPNMGQGRDTSRSPLQDSIEMIQSVMDRSGCLSNPGQAE